MKNFWHRSSPHCSTFVEANFIHFFINPTIGYCQEGDGKGGWGGEESSPYPAPPKSSIQNHVLVVGPKTIWGVGMPLIVPLM